MARVQGKERRALAREVGIAKAINQALIDGLRQPVIRLDSVGVVVVSSEVPAKGGDLKVG
jgi:hypothetical protein